MLIKQLVYISLKQRKKQLLLHPRAREQKNTFFDELPPNGQDNDIIQSLLALDYKTYMVDDILTKVDRATMSVSLEGREPLLDHRIIEFAAQLPSYLKYHNGNKKYILKEITHKYLPKELMNRPKMGFGVPIINWFQKELKELLDYYFSEKWLSQQGLFNFHTVNSIILAYKRGETGNIHKIWILLMFQMWWEKWMK